jgi:hypothetical protein
MSIVIEGQIQMDGDLAYFQLRASEEKVAAANAAHPRARQSHLDMAQRYEELIWVKAASEPTSGLQFPTLRRS